MSDSCIHVLIVYFQSIVNRLCKNWMPATVTNACHGQYVKRLHTPVLMVLLKDGNVDMWKYRHMLHKCIMGKAWGRHCASLCRIVNFKSNVKSVSLKEEISSVKYQQHFHMTFLLVSQQRTFSSSNFSKWFSYLNKHFHVLPHLMKREVKSPAALSGPTRTGICGMWKMTKHSRTSTDKKHN